MRGEVKDWNKKINCYSALFVLGLMTSQEAHKLSQLAGFSKLVSVHTQQSEVATEVPHGSLVEQAHQI